MSWTWEALLESTARFISCDWLCSWPNSLLTNIKSYPLFIKGFLLDPVLHGMRITLSPKHMYWGAIHECFKLHPGSCIFLRQVFTAKKYIETYRRCKGRNPQCILYRILIRHHLPLWSQYFVYSTLIVFRWAWPIITFMVACDDFNLIKDE